MEMEQEKQRDLSRLAAYHDIFVADGYVFATMGGGQEVEPGVLQMPFPVYAREVSDFIQTCYDDRWVTPSVDWPTWIGTSEATDLRDNPDVLARATSEQLAKLLTVLIRQERFCDGAMSEAFDSGLLRGILRRAKALAVGDTP